jgi:hypothetical protein
MSLWKKLFGGNRSVAPAAAAPVNWDELPPISGVVLLDADAFSRAPAILSGLPGLRTALAATATTFFGDGSPEEISELVGMKCQLVASVDTSAGLSASRLGAATQSLCRDNGIELVEADAGRLGVAALYAAMFPDAWGEFHVVVDANLTKDHWTRLFAAIPKTVDGPARMTFARSAEGNYVAAVVHRKLVKAHNLVSVDAGPSFNDFCGDAADGWHALRLWEGRGSQKP